ncbi:hypothetical protein HK105_203050 [Polyrhizophydium stewartii]|uniref:Uncharacterized protein n=1 Tax=Polyrhizophydium stewartii TaxID=2732419 RepID=A0ABR4ND55_9FUNG|nr:hypothetical protein HK105_007896 [Polyrhizophydium stewartii]
MAVASDDHVAGADGIGTPASGPSMSLEQLKAIAAQVQQSGRPKSASKRTNPNVPKTKEQKAEFDLAFSTRPKLPRTPQPVGSSEDLAMNAGGAQLAGSSSVGGSHPNLYALAQGPGAQAGAHSGRSSSLGQIHGAPSHGLLSAAQSRTLSRLSQY